MEYADHSHQPSASDSESESITSSSSCDSSELGALLRKKGTKEVTLDELLQISGFYDEVIAGNEQSIRCLSKEHILHSLFAEVSCMKETIGTSHCLLNLQPRRRP
jgi:hypothetical protein